MSKPCRYCGSEIDFILDRRGKWRAVEAEFWDIVVPDPSALVTVLDSANDWQQVRAKEVRAYTAHSCGQRLGWRRPAVELPEDPVPPPAEPPAEPEPPLPVCEECSGRHDPAGPHAPCECGRGPIVGFGVCAVCLDALEPDPARYPNGELGTRCWSCDAPPQTACVRADGKPTARPHPSRPHTVLWDSRTHPAPISKAEIEDQRRQGRRMDLNALRGWLWDYGSLLTGDDDTPTEEAPLGGTASDPAP